MYIALKFNCSVRPVLAQLVWMSCKWVFDMCDARRRQYCPSSRPTPTVWIANRHPSAPTHQPTVLSDTLRIYTVKHIRPNALEYPKKRTPSAARECWHSVSWIGISKARARPSTKFKSKLINCNELRPLNGNGSGRSPKKQWVIWHLQQQLSLACSRVRSQARIWVAACRMCTQHRRHVLKKSSPSAEKFNFVRAFQSRHANWCRTMAYTKDFD